MIGRTVGNFRIVEKLGEGGMGSVYRAIDQMVERNVAIKVLKPEASDAATYERFRSEALALAKLNHPAVALLYSFFREGEEYFMAMEFVPGQNLEALIRAEGALPSERAAGILLRVLDGIGHAHAQGIVHRDLKPANIMLTPDGGVKITDFGIARVFDTPKLTRTRFVVGSMEYMAPERALGKEDDARSDIYSLGVVFYEMLTGRIPFKRTSDYELIRALVEQDPPAPSTQGIAVPPAIEQALMVALAKDPDARHPSAAAFAAALRAGMGTAEVPLPDAPAPRAVAQAAASPRTHRKLLVALAAGTVGVLLLAIGLAFYFQRQRTVHQVAEVKAAPAPAPVIPAPAAEMPAPALDTGIALPEPEADRPSPSMFPLPAGAAAPPKSKPAQPAPDAATPPAPTPDATMPPKPAARSVGSLIEVRTIYLEPMPENLDLYIRQEMEKELAGKVRLVSSAASADALMSVAIEDEHGGRVTGAAGRLVGLKGNKRAVVTISDRAGTRQLWTATVDDRHSFVTALGDDLKRLASRIAKRLRSDLR